MPAHDNLCVFHTVNEYLDCFQFLAIMDNTAMYILMKIFIHFKETMSLLPPVATLMGSVRCFLCEIIKLLCENASVKKILREDIIPALPPHITV